MGLFSRRTQKPVAEAKPSAPLDFRTHIRTDQAASGNQVEVAFEGRLYRVRNICEGGVALEIDEAMAPGRGAMQIYRNGAFLREGYAMRAWGRGQTVGYKLTSRLVFAAATTDDPRQAALAATAEATPSNADRLRARIGL